MLTDFLKSQYYNLIARELKGAKTVLDVGCGEASVISKVKNRKDFHSTGVDAYPGYIEISRQQGIHDEYIVADITKINFPPKSFDVVISVDVVEHFEKDEAIQLLERMESWAKKKVICITPNGWSPPHVHEAPRDDELSTELMRHKCGWTADDFKERGYRVRGAKGLKRFTFHMEKGQAIYTYDETPVRKLMAQISSAFTYPFPRMAMKLLAIKDLTKDA
jgi:SAM-dependent methyltransferase